MAEPCTLKMRAQVQEELNAALTYMAMGAHFSRDTVNRPGFAKMFFESASEEREHAIKIISYLLMRGELTSDISTLIRNPEPLHERWDTGFEALTDALNLESNVTSKIRDIITVCENPSKEEDAFNDYHLVDYLSGDFLEEQYKGQKDLAHKLSILGKMLDNYGALGEFLFDKKLLYGELF
ncbi:ferritin subunit isoform X2 [Zootermopsis nevadensis]|nr:ferritin subunit isoform X2 [Zootermopsis nevadensis]